ATRDLRPFPTRRSSDLRSAWRGRRSETLGACGGGGARHGLFPRALQEGRLGGGARRRRGGRRARARELTETAACGIFASDTSPRSEEHTSELQSRENLV